MVNKIQKVLFIIHNILRFYFSIKPYSDIGNTSLHVVSLIVSLLVEPHPLLLRLFAPSHLLSLE